MKKTIISIICVITLLITGSVLPVVTAAAGGKITLQTPENWQMSPGDSRSLDVTFSNVPIADQALIWESSNPLVASVDIWGRITALCEGETLISVKSKTDPSLFSSATIKITATPDVFGNNYDEVSFNDVAYSEIDVETLQKFVDRYNFTEAKNQADLPVEIAICISAENTLLVPDNANTQTQTADSAIWTIEQYGVKRFNSAEAVERNREQRFMGDRYFADAVSPIIAIASDGENGIWTINAAGVTHIIMERLSLEDKAILMSDNTQKHVSRRGMVSQAYRGSNGTWTTRENDNDGLWTAMYGAGEIFRYGTLNEQLKANPNDENLREQVAAAKAVATQSAEAVLLLGNISARTGTTEAYVRYIPNNTNPVDQVITDYSVYALLAGKDYLINRNAITPSIENFDRDEDLFKPYNANDWLDSNLYPNADYAKRTRQLEGFIARTYVLGGLESPTLNDGYYYDITGDTAVCMTEKGMKNGEVRKGEIIDASLDIPQRLMKLIDTVEKPGSNGEYFSKDDIIYKADTSADELIGHLFIYKIAYDILGPEDEELKEIIKNTVVRLAQHFIDNNYNLIDGSGQPTTWGKYNREWFLNLQAIGDAPLHSLVLLMTFKLAAHMTHEQKWEDEYRLLALGDAYRYADMAGEYWERWYFAVDTVLAEYGIPSFLINSEASEYIIRNFLSYSNEEMGMLAYYLIFQLEKDELLLEKYRKGIDAWWTSIKYSENPLWYYIYQLAYPDEVKTDAYGNIIIETAAWSLSRHPIDTIGWKASNPLRDDIAEFDLGGMLGLDSSIISYNKKTSTIDTSLSPIMTAASLIVGTIDLDYAVAAPDERSFHKYNTCSYKLEKDHNPNRMEGSTTYTLPYWMGRYHGLLQTTAATKDKTALVNAVDSLSVTYTDSKIYSEKTWVVFASALEKAQNVLAKEGASQFEIDAALNALENAANSLVLRSDEPRYESVFDKIYTVFQKVIQMMREAFSLFSPSLDKILGHFIEI